MPLRPGNRSIFLLNLTNTTHTKLNAKLSLVHAQFSKSA